MLNNPFRELREMLELERENRHLLHRILKHLHISTFTIKVTLENKMAISVGTTGTFTAQLEDNGNPISLPSGSTFAWSADDTNAALAPSADSTSVVVTVPATDTATSITVTASTTAPDGSTVSGSVTVPITPGVAHTFTVLVSQVS
jgi:hypothetical protein